MAVLEAKGSPNWYRLGVSNNVATCKYHICILNFHFFGDDNAMRVEGFFSKHKLDIYVSFSVSAQTKVVIFTQELVKGLISQHIL